MRVALLGDTMLGRGVADRLRQDGPYTLFSPALREVVADADCVIANLECCISDRGEKWDPAFKPFHFRAPPSAVEVLNWLNVDCVNLANNHALDYGYSAFHDTLRYLREAGIGAVGAGGSVAEARRGAVLVKHGFRLAVVGFADHPSDFAATNVRAGTAYADVRNGTPGWLTSSVHDLARVADAVLVTPHWGPNMTTEPLPEFKRCARTLVQSGATLIAGHSAHVFHGCAPHVFYDLGDVIDDYMRYRDVRNDLGIIGFAEIGRPRLEVLPIHLSFAYTDIASGRDRKWIAARLSAACAELGTEVRQADGADGMLTVRW
ncbi:CapA family protein [Hoyosella subflava]|uniref:Poly-gamma-glutamate biosynthesis protein n=1 Tax=Hoyosella subflava (strain DSM 45089 / JCM 17490 / NBRC 109087 / DQS3-9A1) TaxID=443218 RepID=F6EGH9_HOYSD|nr:CapA family protein [Hoyosella subflava]AEF41032.1 Poly-gamma-glutamate biosynthesis protein [Hoyosella subflava DQS3-9A1]